jgi:hypothetical protein
MINMGRKEKAHSSSRYVVINDEYHELIGPRKSISEINREFESYHRDSGHYRRSRPGHNDEEDLSRDDGNVALRYQGPEAQDLLDESDDDSQPEMPGTRPIESGHHHVPLRDEMDTDYGASEVSIFRRFSFWSGLATLSLFLAIASLTSVGFLSYTVLVPVGTLLFATSLIFLKLWYDLGNQINFT